MNFGGIDGHMGKQTLNAERDSSSVMQRRIIRDAVPSRFLAESINGHAVAAAPSRVWGGTDDYLSRRNYNCGGPSPSAGTGLSVPFSGMLRAAVQNCDNTGVEGANTNPRFVPDGSSFGQYRALASAMQTYNK